MAGHVMVEELRGAADMDVYDIGPRNMPFPDSRTCDLRDIAAVRSSIDEIAPEVIVNCTGVLVKASEESKLDAIWINAYFPQLLSAICAETGIRLIHLSTDCVFSGLNGPYRETSFRDGDDYYGRSKCLGELFNRRDLTIRTSIIGPELRKNGTGLLHWMLMQVNSVNGYTAALWSGVTTLELARFVYFVITNQINLSGLVHYSVNGGISKYDLLNQISRAFGLAITIQPVDLPHLDKRLICSRNDIGIAPPPYLDQLTALAQFMRTHQKLYPHYNLRTQ